MRLQTLSLYLLSLLTGIVLLTVSGVSTSPLSIQQQSSGTSHHHHQSDACDWEGSSSLTSEEAERVVVPVYLRCSRGTIKWHYPRGALRVVLRTSANGNSNQNKKDFRGCIRVAQNSSTNVRIYIEGHRQLHNLYASDDGKQNDLLRCFVSQDGQIALYIETEPTSVIDFRRDIVTFSYDLKTVPSERALLDDMDDCRPCDDREIHTTFCTSDFIIRGRVTQVINNKPLERTELTVNAIEVIKDPLDHSFSLKSGNLTTEQLLSAANRYGIERTFTLHRPLKCGTKSAPRDQEFLFLGHWILGNPVITCAPQLTYWKHVRSKAIGSGANQCHLD